VTCLACKALRLRNSSKVGRKRDEITGGWRELFIGDLHILCSLPIAQSVGIATGYGLDDREVRVRVPLVSRIFSSPRRPDRIWGPPNLLFYGYRGLFPRESSGRDVKLTTHLQLLPRSRKCGSILVHLLLHTSSWRSA
jgi:hypothetical protein